MTNKVASTLKTIAVVTFVAGGIAGLLLSYVEVPYMNSIYDYGTTSEFSLTILFTVWGSAFISGMLFRGFAEVIELIQVLVNNSKSIALNDKSEDEILTKF